MDVTVTMEAEEFQEFMAWRKDKSHYRSEMDAWNRKWEMLANKAPAPGADNTAQVEQMRGGQKAVLEWLYYSILPDGLQAAKFNGAAAPYSSGKSY